MEEAATGTITFAFKHYAQIAKIKSLQWYFLLWLSLIRIRTTNWFPPLQEPVEPVSPAVFAELEAQKTSKQWSSQDNVVSIEK